MLLCDHIIREDHTGKPSLIGVFENINVAEAPTEERPVIHPIMTLYAKIAGAEGSYKWRFEFVREKDNRVIGADNIDEIQHPDRRRTHDIVVRMVLLPFPELGRYSFRLYANDRFVGDIVCDVLLFRQEPRT